MEFLLGLIVFVLSVGLSVYAIAKTLQSAASVEVKVVWVLVVLILPVLGFILWLLFGPKGTTTAV